MNIIIFLAILLILVLVHEWGHFFSAKKFGIRVDEFGFGFPPKLFGVKKGETEYTFNLIPFGGFVKIFGENPDDENTNGPDRDRSFVNKPKWQQAVVLFAGVFMNFVLAGFLFSIVFLMGSPLATNSIPLSAKERMSEYSIILGVLKDGPAYVAGLKEGDIILSLETKSEKISNPTFSELVEFSNQPGETIHVSFTRQGKEYSVDVIPELDTELGRAFIGVSPATLSSGKFNFYESFKYGFGTAALSAKDTVISFGKLLKGGEDSKLARESVVGPVGLVKVTGFVYAIGIGYLISFMAVISISLAVINLVPFPALDGGRLFFLLIEAIKGSRMNTKVINMINMVGFFTLIGLMLFVTYKDIVKLF